MLTVYVSGTYHDPSARTVWRVQLDQALDAARKKLADASHAERQRFERCIQLLEGELEASSSIHAAPGWVAFITPAAVRRAEQLPADVPTSAVWGIGPHITPYIRTMVEDQHGVIAVADARKVTVYEYRGGGITQRQVVHAHPHLLPPLHMGDVPRQGFHPGVRRETGREAAQRARGEGTERMLRKVVDQMASLAGADGWILVGGIPEASSRLMHHLPQSVLSRVVLLDSLDVHASQAVILHVAQREISAMRNAAAAQQAAQLVATGGGHDGRVATDPGVIRQALEQSRVHALYLTDHYLGGTGEDAETALLMAFSQRAHIHVITGPWGHTLDDHGGVVARLRYGVQEVQHSASS